VTAAPLFPAKVARIGINDAPTRRATKLREIAGEAACARQFATERATPGPRTFVPAWRHSLGLTRPLLAAGVLAAIALAARRLGGGRRYRPAIRQNACMMGADHKPP